MKTRIIRLPPGMSHLHEVCAGAKLAHQSCTANPRHPVRVKGEHVNVTYSPRTGLEINTPSLKDRARAIIRKATK